MSTILTGKVSMVVTNKQNNVENGKFQQTVKLEMYDNLLGELLCTIFSFYLQIAFIVYIFVIEHYFSAKEIF